jgi:DNA ligase-1
MLFAEVARTSEAIGKTRSRLSKIELLATLLARLQRDEIAPAVALLSGEPRQGKIGVGVALARRLLATPAVSDPSVTLTQVDAVLERFSATTGRGTQAGRETLLGQLFAQLTNIEQHFLAHVIAGGLRQGALEAIVLEAVARASQVPIGLLRRSLMFAGRLDVVARAALFGGVAELERFSLTLFTPLRPMLADSAADVDDALTRVPSAALEYKLDGARVQVHRAGSDVRVFSRSGQDVTLRVPEIVEAARSLPGQSIVLDGEAVALDTNQRPLPFQTTMQRFGRQKSHESLRATLPLSQMYFDCLYLDGEVLLDRSNGERFGALTKVLPSGLVVPRTVTEEPEAAESFVHAALAAGHEGVIVKDSTSVYDAGRRGSSWLKLKPVHTLDLVVLAAEWGSGRRQGWLSNIHLGARDEEHGGFAMLGKTFKGMTDEMLAWQTRKFQELARDQTGYVVWLRPELVVEIAFDGVQASSQYASGFALRFARVKRYRDDKPAGEADTLTRVRQIFEHSRG